MKNAKLLIMMSILSFSIAACGMKGPLYQAPASDTKEAAKETQLPRQENTDIDNEANNS
ncbi:lipoprotein [Psychromonas sp. MME2]|uniref:LPS translocon maturation chaperone LptM n=1 Tax=unclassified Psychromonas TaxID=2614957 RepID=UPI00339CF887